MYSTHTSGKSVETNFTNKIYKHMAAISNNVYFNIFNDTVDKYNNTYHKTIQMKPIDVKSDSFAAYNERSSEKDPKCKVRDHVRVSMSKNIFAKGYVPN